MSGVAAASIVEAAERLRVAAETRQPCAPVRDLVGTATDVEVGYAIQQINIDRAIASGRRVSGRKIGLTSTAVQAQLGVDRPDFGTLFADTEYGDGIALDAHRLMQPRAEAEVALVLERDLTHEQPTFNDIVRATAYALASIEVVDSRVDGWDIRFVDTVADNASCGLYVLGGRPVPLRDVDLRSIPMTMTINGVEASTGAGSACLGHPLHAARWLATTMVARGTPLRAGDVVMTGALGPMRPIGPGDVVVADFGPLGTVTTHIDA
jgi:2-keto-4-pentenoate hydratase